MNNKNKANNAINEWIKTINRLVQKGELKQAFKDS